MRHHTPIFARLVRRAWQGGRSLLPPHFPAAYHRNVRKASRTFTSFARAHVLACCCRLSGFCLGDVAVAVLVKTQTRRRYSKKLGWVVVSYILYRIISCLLCTLLCAFLPRFPYLLERFTPHLPLLLTCSPSAASDDSCRTYTAHEACGFLHRASGCQQKTRRGGREVEADSPPVKRVWRCGS